MKKTFLDGRVTLHPGDCLDVLVRLEECSIDSCVTDPPYHLTSQIATTRSAFPGRYAGTEGAAVGFMGKQWDGGDIAFRPDVWREVFRVLKPGAHLVAFGGTRTYHRMACAIEDVGFEIRDQIQWLYGSGFPKSHDVSKGIDRAAGVKFEASPASGVGFMGPDRPGGYNRTIHQLKRSGKSTDAAKEWSGWGTALKPSHEPVVLARKPLSESTVAANVLKWGTGAINVDGCRVGSEQRINPPCALKDENVALDGHWRIDALPTETNGRWPANVIHDGSEEVVGAFPETQSTPPGNIKPSPSTANAYGEYRKRSLIGHTDSGSAARFFYTSKADANDRLGSKHPTVKPLDLMQYLVRLVTPPRGLVLDPFAGTGTTGEAAWREGMCAVLIEREAEYQSDIRRRMALALAGPNEKTVAIVKAKGLTASPGPLFEVLS